MVIHKYILNPSQTEMAYGIRTDKMVEVTVKEAESKDVIKNKIQSIFSKNYTLGGSFGNNKNEGLCFTYNDLDKIVNSIVNLM